MKKCLIFLLALLSVVSVFAQINSGSPKVPFGSNSKYQYGIMPTNLPTTGTYGTSSKAAEAYEAWKAAYVTTCAGGQYRVKFDDGTSTVSEGIAYGMLLSVYAADKAVFDGLWAYYKTNMNGNGIMHWKISGCNSVTGQNGATDAELDAAMALIIAAEQWPSGSTAYLADAKTLIGKIKTYEMTNTGQTLNGDAWGNTNTCRNPSYFSPAYYTEFAKVDLANATFWNTTAINASNTILLANRNATSGLVSNWSDDTGKANECGPTGSGSYGYGADACRNPWRMAVDYLWHGTSASSAAKDINTKLTAFVNGYESSMKGPFANMGVSNPSSGAYINGSYSTFALPPMASASAQSSLNKCYTAVANLANVDVYFNSTIRCITLFTLTGNFWAPGASGMVFPPSILTSVTNGAGTQIILTSNKALTTSAVTASNFSLFLNGTAQTSAITSVTISGSTITLGVAAGSKPQPGQAITLSYTGTGNIKSTDGATLEAFTKINVLNLLEGNETILDDCDDGNELNNVGGIWFSFNDSGDQNKACTKGATVSSITPLSSVTSPLKMTAPGYNSTAYALNASYKLGANYTPYASGTSGPCATWNNPSYVGIGTWVDDVETNTMDWRTGTGVSFWYKGPACSFQVIIKEVTNFAFHFKAIPATTDWTKYTILWADLSQPTWCPVAQKVAFTAQNVQKLQWQYETGTSGVANSTGVIWIDDVRIMNMPPVALTGLTILPVPNADLIAKKSNPNADPLKLKIGSAAAGDTLFLKVTATPVDASYPVVFWSSSDEDVVKVDYQGRVVGVGYGEATITARSKMHQSIIATYTVKVPPPSVNPTAISFTPSTYSVGIGESAVLTPTFAPANVTETGLTWTSSNDAIVTVSSTGQITGITAGGPVTITATSKVAPTVKGTATVNVTSVLPSTITVTLAESSIASNGSTTATADVLPANAAVKTVTWTSSNTAVATVDAATGAITAVGAGNTTITATSTAAPTIKGTATLTVTAILPTTITVTLTPASVSVGTASAATATVEPTNASIKTVTWTSSNTAVATVNATTGAITTLSEGTTIITATSTSAPTIKGDATLTVTAVLPTTISVTLAPATVPVGTASAATATVLPANATIKTVTWSSSNELVATVNATTGAITTLAEGTAEITATSTSAPTIKGSATLTVSAILPTSISVTLTPASIQADGTSAATATVLPANASIKTVTWSSSNELAATVNATTGAITAVGVGTTTITATSTSAPTIKGTAILTVTKIPVTNISVSETSLIIEVGKSANVIGAIEPTTATNKTIDWVSSNQAIATVTSNGAISGVAVGKITITVTAADNASITKTISVEVVNKSTLTSKITSATDAYTAAVEGTADGEYPVGAKADLQTAINAAQLVKDNALATQTQIDAANMALTNALNLFIASVNTSAPVDKTVLEQTITSTQAIHDAALEGTSNNQYPAGSKATLQAAIDDAQAIYIDAAATQAQVNIADANVKAALALFNSLKITIDKSNLLSLITSAQATHDAAAEGTGNGQYPTGSKADLQTAIDAATAVSVAVGTSQTEINTATTNLQTAIDAFKAKVIGVNKSALAALIVSGQNTHDNATEGLADGNYPSGSKAILQTAINDATTVNTNASASQTAVDAAKTTLQTAIDAFKAKVIGIDKSALSALITNAQTTLGTAEEGVSTNQYPSGSKAILQTAITAASDVNISTTATQTEVNTALADLQTAFDAFKAKKITVNFAALQTSITEAQGVLGAATVGSAQGNYPQQAYDTYEQAIADADIVAKNTAATQAQVDAAIAALLSAKTIFEGSVIGAPTTDFTALITTITSAQVKHDAAAEGTQINTYEVGSKATLQAAIDAATQVKNTPTASQQEINTAKTTLDNAVIAFEAKKISAPVVDKTALTAAINAAQDVHDNATEGLSNGNYPSGSKAILQTAIDAAVLVEGNIMSSQTQIDAAKTTLDAAVVAFENKVITINKTTLEASIVTAQDLVDNSDYGINYNQYPESAKAPLEAAIASAKSVVASLTVTQAEVNAANTTLQAAINTFKATKNTVDKSALQTQIVDAQSTYDISKELVQGGVYPNGSKATLLAAINAASTVNSNALATQTQVNSAKTTLQTALQTFINSATSVDKEPLKELITEAQALYILSVGNTGTSAGQYSELAANALEAQILLAQSVVNNPATTNAQVNSAVVSLQVKIDAFNDSKVPSVIDNAMLAELLDEVQTALENAKISTTVDQPGFPLTQYLNLTKVYNKSLNTYETATVQYLITEAYENLNAAYIEFLASENTAVTNVEETSLEVYPTIVVNQITIASKKVIAKVSISSFGGATVKQISVNSVKTNISLSSIRPGSYIITAVYVDGSSQIARFVKK